MAQPVLRTARLVLVPLADEHVELEVALDADPEVLRYISGRAHTRDEVISSHASRMALGRKVDGLGYWIAFDAASAGSASTSSASTSSASTSSASTSSASTSSASISFALAGFVGVMMLPPANGPDQPDDPSVAELGYRIVRRFWRQGLASEASRVLLRHAFETVGQERVIAQTMAVNAGSRRVMEAVGMRYVRTFHGTWDDPLPGTEEGEVEYELTREMWLSA